jgi:hypothetical protein
VHVARSGRQRQRDPRDCVELCDRYLDVGHGERRRPIAPR